jgi:hypothetical protein
VLHATERGKPTRVTASTAYSLQTFRSRRAEAIENLGWYALRWKIETNNKILKSGSRAEQLEGRGAERREHDDLRFLLAVV